MSKRPSRYHRWTDEEIKWIEDNADRETIKSLASRFGVSEWAIRSLINHKFNEQTGDQFRKIEKGNLRQAEVICPYYTSTISSGIKCDGQFIYCIPRTKTRSHTLNHCCKYYTQEKNGHCEMRQMLNGKWGMEV